MSAPADHHHHEATASPDSESAEIYSTLIQAAHEEPDVQALLNAYKEMEEQGEFRRLSHSTLHPHSRVNAFVVPSPSPWASPDENLWVQKHVRPDGSVFALHTDAASAFGAGDLNFNWGFGPIKIKCSVDRVKLFIEAGMYLNYLGTKELLVLKGDLNKGVSGTINQQLVKGPVTFYLKDDKQLCVKLDLSGPVVPTIDKEFKLINL